MQATSGNLVTPISAEATPSTFVFIHELRSLPVQTKVRFLGCVLDYDTASGRLLLEHAYPHDAVPTPRVSVDATLILESTPGTILRNGSWINVMAYVQGHPASATKSTRSTTQSMKNFIPSVQAVLVWDAGAVHIAEYEATLEEQKRVQKSLEVLQI